LGEGELESFCCFEAVPPVVVAAVPPVGEATGAIETGTWVSELGLADGRFVAVQSPSSTVPFGLTFAVRITSFGFSLPNRNVIL
jgi:hypothetical protein